MDILQDYAIQAFALYANATSSSSSSSPSPPLPATIQTYLTTYIAPVFPYLQPLLAPMQQILSPLTTHLASSPLLLSFFFLLFVLFVSLQLLNLFRRLFMWIVGLVIKMLFWGTLVLVAVKVAQRGVGETVGDLERWAAEVGRVWWREYERWEGVGRDGGGGGGGGKGRGW